MNDLRAKIAEYLDEKFPEYDAASTYEAADAIMELPEIAEAQDTIAKLTEIVSAAKALDVWLQASLYCEQHQWDADQREVAEAHLATSRAALAQTKGEVG